MVLINKMVLLDTNIVLTYIRKYALVPDACFISIVTVGELKAFALKRNWGKQKRDILQVNLGRLHIIDIPLQTTDNDFDHLAEFGLKLDKIGS